MIPGLLLPASLAALAALAIPLIIHVARRTESRRVTFAALRWLSPEPRPRSRPRVDERLLLATRLALLALVAVVLARPVLWDAEDRRPVTAVAPGLDAPSPESSGAGGREGERRLVRLAPGFPGLDAPIADGSADLISLLRQLDAELPPGATLQAVVPSTLAGADAERPRLSRPVDWRAAPDPVAPVAAAAPAPPRLVVRYSREAPERVRWFRAAASAWADPGAAPAFEAETADRALPAGTRTLVWLAPGPVPEPALAPVRAGGAILIAHDASAPSTGEARPVWRDADGAPLATEARLGAGRVLRLTRPLEPAAMPALADASFPDMLERLLQPPPAPARVRAVDHAPLVGAASAFQRSFRNLSDWAALLAALIFFAERWLATRVRPAAAP